MAILAPLPQSRSLDQMLAIGEIEAASSEIDELPEPMPLPEGAEPPSLVLARQRREER